MDDQLSLHQSKIRLLKEHLSKVWSNRIWGEDQIVKKLTTYSPFECYRPPKKIITNSF
jgi:hypothetical protein